MEIWPIDGKDLLDQMENTPWYDNADRDIAEELVLNMPTLIPPNEPLSLDELRKMDGQPVWVVVSENWKASGIKGGWCLVAFHINDDRVRLYMFNTRTGGYFFPEQDMGRSYWVYRRPPEEAP